MDVRRLPNETTLRFLLLAIAVVGSTLAVAEGLWYTVFLDEANAVLERCAQNDALLALQLCRRGQEHERVLWVLLTAMIVLALGVLGAVLGSMLRRRVRRLVPAPGVVSGVIEPVLQANELLLLPVLRSRRRSISQARADGIIWPYVEVGTNWLGLAMTDPAQARAVLAHEVAHVRRRDILPSRTSLWLANVFVLYAMVYLVWTASTGLRPTVEAALRAGLVVGVVVLARLAVLRAREHAADIEAAAFEPEALARTFATATQTKRLFSTHPAPARRREVVSLPPLAARLNWLDGALVGFTASVAAPVLSRLWRSWFQFGDPAYWAELFGWGVIGSLFGVWSALIMFRAVAGARAEGSPMRLAAFSWSLAGAVVVGRFLYSTSLGLPMEAIPTTAVGVVTLLALAFGAVAVAQWQHGLAEWWLDLQPARRRSWAIAVPAVLGGAFGAAVFGVLGHLASMGAIAGEGWFIVVQVLLTQAEARVMVVVLGVVGLSLLLLLFSKPRSEGPLPGWLDPRPGPVQSRVRPYGTIAIGVVAGFGGALAYAIYTVGWHPADVATRSWYGAANAGYASQMMVGGMVAVGAAVAALLTRRVSPQHAAIAALVGTVPASGGAWLVRSLDQNRIEFSLLDDVFFDVLVIGTGGGLIGSAVLLALWPVSWQMPARWAAATVITVGAAIALVAVGVACLRATPSVERDFQQFTTVVSAVRDDLTLSIQNCLQLTPSDQSLTETQRALFSLQAAAAAPGTPQVRELHATLVSALTTCELAFQSALASDDDTMELTDIEPAIESLTRFQRLYDDLDKSLS